MTTALKSAEATERGRSDYSLLSLAALSATAAALCLAMLFNDRLWLVFTVIAFKDAAAAARMVGDLRGRWRLAMDRSAGAVPVRMRVRAAVGGTLLMVFLGDLTVLWMVDACGRR